MGMFSTRNYLKENKGTIELVSGVSIPCSRPQVTCKDGFSVFIQASENHYCSPRKTLTNGDYKSVELGYPSAPDELIADYAEDPDDLTNTVYGYVPVEIVDKLIEKHGGDIPSMQIDEFYDMLKKGAFKVW